MFKNRKSLVSIVSLSSKKSKKIEKNDVSSNLIEQSLVVTCCNNVKNFFREIIIYE